MTEMNFDVGTRRQARATTLEKLVAKSLVGAVLVVLPTVLNLAFLVKLQGRELGWLCLSICTLDGKCAYSVTHDFMEFSGAVADFELNSDLGSLRSTLAHGRPGGDGRQASLSGATTQQCEEWRARCWHSVMTAWELSSSNVMIL